MKYVMKKTYLYFVIVLLFIPCMAQDLPLARYNDLRFRNGLAYKDGQLFTGILLDTFLINNRPVVIGQFKDGKKNSLFVERYGPNKKKYEGQFVEGKKEGAHFEWYENGNLKSEIYYTEDNINGKVSLWYEDGQKQIDATYLNGMKNGLITEWYANGNKRNEMSYVADKKEGKESVWFENGVIQQEAEYQQGNKHGMFKEWYSNGSLKDSIYYSENIIADGTYNFYTETGEIEHEVTYNKGQLTKEKIIEERFYLNGDYIENIQEIYLNGEKKVTGTLKNGQKDGLWTVTNNTGQIISEEIYNEGNRFIKDINGNTYATVQIGSQCWMKENLKVTKLNNGESLLLNDQPKSYPKEGAYCWYENDEKNGNLFGALYNWEAVERGNLCPKGWHIPSPKEWKVLFDFLGGEEIAGGKLKSIGTELWDYDDNKKYKNMGNEGADNSSGFTGLPGGRKQYWFFVAKGANSFFWTSKRRNNLYGDNRDYAYYAWLAKFLTAAGMLPAVLDNYFYFSVRCIQD
jgi:uncharacterized protein (TIGR02145 family)